MFVENILRSAMLSSNHIMRGAGTVIHDNADKILLGVGISCIVGGTVSAVVSSKNIANIIENHKKAVEQANYIEDKKERGQAKITVYKDTAIEMLMTFGPCVLLTGTGIACIIGSHHILTQRLASCQAAYAMLDTSFREYRERVKATVGAEKENDIFNNTSEVEVEVKDEKGKTKKTKQKVKAGPKSPYSYLFDEANANWQKQGTANRDYLLQRQWWCNDQLNRWGEISLAEVLMNVDAYDYRSDVPALYFDIIWKKGDYVDFGLEDNKDFMDGVEKSTWLHFNPSGFRKKVRQMKESYKKEEVVA